MAGEVLSHDVSKGSLVILAGDINSKGKAILRKVDVSEEFCEVSTGVKLTAKTNRKLTVPLVRQWLEELNYGDLSSENFQIFHEPLAGKAPVKVSSAHLKLFWRHLAWKLQAPQEVCYLDPEMVHAWRACREEAAENAQAHFIMKGHEYIMEGILQRSSLLLAPVFGGKKEGNEHWVLLALQKGLGGLYKVRYYDTLQNLHGECQEAAQELLLLLTQGEVEAIPSRRNVGGQGPLACGFNVCWYLEDEVRHFMGEDWSSRGWRQEMFVRERLCELACSLAKEEQRMRAIDEAWQKALAKQEQTKAVRLKMFKALEAQDFQAKVHALRTGEEFASGVPGLPSLTAWHVKEKERMVEEAKKAQAFLRKKAEAAKKAQEEKEEEEKETQKEKEKEETQKEKEQQASQKEEEKEEERSRLKEDLRKTKEYARMLQEIISNTSGILCFINSYRTI